MDQQRVLILYAHPNSQNSRVNRTLRSAVETLTHVTFHDLYEVYPDFFIDIDVEKQLLLNHEVIVFQHPIYWYHCPALLKEWIDLVLELGWAYGEGGDKLKGKYLLQAVSAGGPTSSYHAQGHNHFSLHELLRPFEQTAHLCHMHYLTPFITYSARIITEQDLQQQSAAYLQLITMLTQGMIPPLFNSFSLK